MSKEIHSQKLYAAAQRDEVKNVKPLLQQGADPTWRNPAEDYRTAVHVAAVEGSLNVLPLLLRAEAALTTKDGHGRTPLHLAARFGQHESLRVMLEKRLVTDLDIPGHKSLTPMMEAVACGATECIEILMKNGASITPKKKGKSTLLHFASRMGQFASVKFLLALRPEDVRAVRTNDFTPLHEAAIGGYSNCAELLLDAGAPIDSRDDKGRTPLHYACLRGQHIVVRLLVARGADVNVGDGTGKTPLHFASYSGDSDSIVELVQSHQLDVNRKDHNGLGALHFSYFNVDRECATLLADHGLKIDGTDARGRTSLHFAVVNGQRDYAEFLLQRGANPDHGDEDNVTPLHLAASHGHADLVRLLIEYKAEVAITDRQGLSPLHHAIICRENDCVKMLLVAGAEQWTGTTLDDYFSKRYGKAPPKLEKRKSDIMTPKRSQKMKYRNREASRYRKSVMLETADIRGFTPLMLASAIGNTEAMEILLKNRAEPMAKDSRRGWNAFHFAAANGQCGSLRLLASRGIDVNCVSDQGNSALHIAAWYGKEESITTLLSLGCKRHIRGENKEVPLHFACRRGHVGCVRLLCEDAANVDTKSASGCTPLHIAARGGHKEAVEVLLVNDVRVSETGQNGWTAMHEAAANGHVNVLHALLPHIEEGEELLNDKLQTPLHLSILFGYPDCCETLLEEGAVDPNAQDIEGRTCLHVACRLDQDGSLVSDLLTADANAAMKDENGMTPAHYAAMNRNIGALNALISQGAPAGEADEMGWTPLHFAAQMGNTEHLELLLRVSEIDVNTLARFDAFRLQGLSGRKTVIPMPPKRSTSPLGLKEDIHDPFLRGCGITPLHLAALQETSACVDVLRRAGAKCEVCDEDENTPLMWAASAGRDRVVQSLIKHGANVNSINANGWSPVYMTCALGHDKSLLHFVRAKAKLVPPQSGISSLHIASAMGHPRCIRILVGRGAVNPDFPDQNGLTPLVYGILHGQDEVVTHLCQMNADVNAKDRQELAPVHHAALAGTPEMIESLVEEGANVNQLDSFGMSPLMYAVIASIPPNVKKLIDLGASVHSSDGRTGMSAIHGAALVGDAFVIGLVINAAKAQISSISSPPVSPQTPVEGARSQGTTLVEKKRMRMSVASVFTAAMASTRLSHSPRRRRRPVVDPSEAVDTADRRGRTPLSIASERGHTEVVRMLLEAGARPLAEDAAGRTPVHYATKKDEEGTLRALLSGVHVGEVAMRKDREGFSPLLQCIENRNEDLFQHYFNALIPGDLQALAESPITSLECYLLCRAIATADFLTGSIRKSVAHVVKLFEILRPENGWSPIHFAVSHRDLPTAKLLLSEGADANSYDSTRWSALHEAALRDHGDMVRLLIDSYRARPNVRSKSGISPLHVACHCGAAAAANALMERRADATSITVAGLTPMHLACAMGHDSCVEVVVENIRDPVVLDQVVGAVDVLGQSPLEWAALFGHTSVAEMFRTRLRPFSFDEVQVMNAQKIAAALGNTDFVSVLNLIREGDSKTVLPSPIRMEDHTPKDDEEGKIEQETSLPAPLQLNLAAFKERVRRKRELARAERREDEEKERKERRVSPKRKETRREMDEVEETDEMEEMEEERYGEEEKEEEGEEERVKPRTVDDADISARLKKEKERMEAELLRLEGLEEDEDFEFEHDKRRSDADDYDGEDVKSIGEASEETSPKEVERQSLPYEPENEEEFMDDEDVPVEYPVEYSVEQEPHVEDGEPRHNEVDVDDDDDDDNDSDAGDDSLVALREKLRNLYEDSF